MENKPPVVHPVPNHFIGIDWADQEHDVYVVDRHGSRRAKTIKQSPEAIEEWISEELKAANGPIAIMLEQSRGALIYALMFRENVILYPVNPKQFARYRESYSNAGCKDDLTDARLLAQMLRERISSLKPWLPDDEDTRLLARLCQTRRRLVDERTRFLQQLTEQLKCCFPLALKLPGITPFSPLMLELLRRYPDPRELRKVDRRILVKIFAEYSLRNETNSRNSSRRFVLQNCCAPTTQSSNPQRS